MQKIESQISAVKVFDSSFRSIMSNASPNKKSFSMDSAIPEDDGFEKVGCDNFEVSVKNRLSEK